MRAYRTLWWTAVAVLATASLAAGGLTIGWAPVLGSTAMLACVGAAIAVSYVDDPRRRRRAIIGCAGWAALSCLMFLGLTILIDYWSLLILGAFAAAYPRLVEHVIRGYRAGRPLRLAAPPECLSDHDLNRRWRRSTQELRDRSSKLADVLRLVEERARLIDELERRDPDGFHELLVRSHWCSTQDRWDAHP
jgi:hypothetical protein